MRFLERLAWLSAFGHSLGDRKDQEQEQSAMTIPVEQAAINLAVALGLSAAIGFERQWRNRLAGLRTNTLVALICPNRSPHGINLRRHRTYWT